MDHKKAGDERIELPPKVLETPIIPFDQSPILKIYLQNCTQNYQILIKIFTESRHLETCGFSMGLLRFKVKLLTD